MNALIDRDALPSDWPTHRHPAALWEELGRTVATFGMLEDVLVKAIFVFTAPTTQYTEERAAEALNQWDAVLDKALTETLSPLADMYGMAVRANKSADFENVKDMVEDIKKAGSLYRNAICHGSWGVPGENGKSELDYWRRSGGKLVKLDSKIDADWLRNVRSHTVTLICHVINSVTVNGWQFPGGAGPGVPVWPPKA